MYAYSAIHSLQMSIAIEKDIQNQSSIMSSNLPIAFLMLMAAAMAQSQGFSTSMIPIVSPRLPCFPRNLTLCRNTPKPGETLESSHPSFHDGIPKHKTFFYYTIPS